MSRVVLAGHGVARKRHVQLLVHVTILVHKRRSGAEEDIAEPRATPGAVHESSRAPIHTVYFLLQSSHGVATVAGTL